MRTITKIRRVTVDKEQFEDMFGKKTKTKILYHARLYPNTKFIVRKGK